MKIYLGLDVSTSCIGISVSAYDGENIKVLHISHLRLKSSRKASQMENLFNKCETFHQHLLKFTEYGITDVIIEEPLISSNNSVTASILLRFNGMISRSVYSILGVIPDFISSYDARKYGFPELMSVRKFNKKGEIYTVKHIRKAMKKSNVVLFGSYPFTCEKKFVLWNKICERYPDIEWVYNKNNELKNENFDASDSLVCVMGYINKIENNGNEAEILEYEEQTFEEGTIFRYKVKFCGKTYDKVLEI